MPMSYWWNFEAFAFTFGLISSMICCGIEARSRSRRRTSRRTTSSRVDDIVGMDIATTPPPVASTRVPVPPSPPLTVFTEYRYDNLPPLPYRSPQRSPTSPVSSRDNTDRFSPPPSEATSRILRSRSLPLKRRRRRHHRSHHSSMLAPITFTETVTLQEAPHYDDSSSSSPAKPMASSARPRTRTSPVQPPPKVDPMPRSSKQSSNPPDIQPSRHTPRNSHAHHSTSTPTIRGDPITRSAASKPAKKPEATIVSDSEYTYMSIPLHQMGQMLPRTSPSTRHHFKHRSVISSAETQYRNFHLLTP